MIIFVFVVYRKDPTAVWMLMITVNFFFFFDYYMQHNEIIKKHKFAAGGATTQTEIKLKTCDFSIPTFNSNSNLFIDFTEIRN